jgi:superfamily II DNA or RNA helicase
MNLSFIRKEPGKAYVANRLWLPKNGVRALPVQRALEFLVQGRRDDGEMGQVELKLWGESSHHIIAPREFINPNDYPNYRFPFVDLRHEFGTVDFEDLVTPRDEEQLRAWQALALHNNGMLVLACGKGKTKLALKKVAQRRTPALIIVPDGGIKSQWVESIYGDGNKKLPGLRFNGTLGDIEGSNFDWKHPVTLALVTTLALRIREGKVPPEMFHYFGQIIYDEVHRIGAPFFSQTAWPFHGDRIGLTATWQREDGLDPVYRYHIGEPFYSDLKQHLIPRIYFEQTTAQMDLSEAHDKNGEVNISKLRSAMGQSLDGNVYRYYAIKDAFDHGRKILALSHSKAQLKLMHAMFPGSGIILGSTPKNDRMRILRESRICFAIAKLGSEGVDDDALDTLFWLTPYRSKISLQQSMGRIQRPNPHKMAPVMTVFEDVLVPPLKSLCRKLRQNLREWNFEVETTHARYPTTLSPEVYNAYEQRRIELQSEQGPDDA